MVSAPIVGVQKNRHAQKPRLVHDGGVVGDHVVGGKQRIDAAAVGGDDARVVDSRRLTG